MLSPVVYGEERRGVEVLYVIEQIVLYFSMDTTLPCYTAFFDLGSSEK